MEQRPLRLGSLRPKIPHSRLIVGFRIPLIRGAQSKVCALRDCGPQISHGSEETSLEKQIGDFPMLTKITAAVAASLIVGSASLALASDNNSGDYSGGFVVPGSTDGVNPAYHRDLSPRTTHGAKSFGFAPGFAPTVNRPTVHQQEGGSYR
jgi:hypothetical protein